MKIALTGWGGFLATKLREQQDIDWTEEVSGADTLVLMGSPTFTHPELSEHDAQVVHQYVRSTIKIIDRYPGNIIFASTTGVNDIQLDHRGTTAYNLAKLYLENYIINHTPNYAILRIGTIVSSRASDVALMKPDRVQPRVHRGDLTGIPFTDKYLEVDVFVNTTTKLLHNFKSGIYDYDLTQLTLSKLSLLGKQ